MATTTNVPTRKVIAGGATGTFVTFLVLILNTYVPYFHNKPISGEMASSATTVLGFLAAYFVPPAASEATIQNPSTGAMQSATK
jgi:hypothetical protein